MPKNKVDYANTIIYKIVCKDLDIKDCYVGSTTNFKSRKTQHRLSHNNPNLKSKYNMKVYRCIRDNGYWENWDMVMIEQYPCENKYQQFKREREWIEKIKPSLNNNKLLNQTKQDRKDYMTEYRKIHSEKLKQQELDYVNRNREEINRKANMKLPCDICGVIMCKKSIPRHKKRKHRD